jgi:glucose-1-phosphatase
MNKDERPIDTQSLRVILFDVGGVLVELRGVETMLEWLDHSVTEYQFWRQWLESPAVRSFETGKSSPQAFAAGVIAEFGLPVEPQRFIESFTHWPTGLYPDTLGMLAQIPPSLRGALLSNSNSLHWPRMMDEMHLGAAIGNHFSSHLTGYIKPDRDAFAHVVQTLSVAPDQVLFLDDNAPNTEAAQSFGMQALRVRGAAEARKTLLDLGIIR